MLVHLVLESIFRAKSTFEQFVVECLSFLFSIEVSEDLFFFLLLVIPTFVAYILDRVDREPSEDEWANTQTNKTVSYKSPTLQSEEVWDKYDQLHKNKVIPALPSFMFSRS